MQKFIISTAAFILFSSIGMAADLKKGSQSVSITSGDGLKGYQDIISGKTPRALDIKAQLYLPEDCGTEKRPAVIIQHGSGLPNAPWYPRLAEALNNNGIIVIVPDSITSRGLKATGKDQSKLSKATRLYDTFATFRYLQKLSCVDVDRVGLTGYSFGGIIAIDSVETTLASKLGNGHAYKASLPVYPSCQATFANTSPTNTKVHILAGGADDYTPAFYCVDSVKAKAAKGWDIDITVYDGAHHGFNNEYSPKKFAKSWTFGACGKLDIDDEGYESSKEHNASTRMGWGKYVKTMAKKCGKRGVTVGGSKELSAATLDFTIKFFNENL